ncbi:Dihydroorotate dehydrogenase (quinone) [Diplonema papillatum]|nr:Dihydroorotate dehydrogenase (quinone) [Diplonema papillatum]
MQNIANTGLATFRTGTTADRYLRGLVFGFFGLTGVYYWAKDSQSTFWTHLLLPSINRFHIDEEFAHRMAVSWLRKGRGPFDYTSIGSSMTTNVFGKTIDHPIMLGAGLDRDGECMYGCFGMGFSGIEVGGITPQKQAGGGMPRIFRIKVDEAIITRAGTPSRGMAVVSYFLEQYRKWEVVAGYPTESRLIGANVAKNKISDDIVDDARIGVKVLSESVDYLTITLNHPQQLDKRTIPSKRWFEDLVASCHKARAKLPEEHRKPILFKVPLDLHEEEKQIIADVSLQQNVDGLVIGYGTLQRPGMLSFHYLSRQPGILVGRPTREMSTELIKDIYNRTKGKVLIVGSGGVSSGQDALDKIEAGATLLQIHTALVEHGPGVVPSIKRELAAVLQDKGYSHISEAVGKATAS